MLSRLLIVPDRRDAARFVGEITMALQSVISTMSLGLVAARAVSVIS